MIDLGNSTTSIGGQRMVKGQTNWGGEEIFQLDSFWVLTSDLKKKKCIFSDANFCCPLPGFFFFLFIFLILWIYKSILWTKCILIYAFLISWDVLLILIDGNLSFTPWNLWPWLLLLIQSVFEEVYHKMRLRSAALHLCMHVTSSRILVLSFPNGASPCLYQRPNTYTYVGNIIVNILSRGFGFILHQW